MSEHVNVEALLIRTGFWCPLYYNCSKEPVIIKALILARILMLRMGRVRWFGAQWVRSWLGESRVR